MPQPGAAYRYLVVETGEEPRYRGRVLVGSPATRCPPFAIFVLPAAKQP